MPMRLQLSLRSLMMAVLVASLALSAIVIWSQKRTRRVAAIAYVEGIGGEVTIADVRHFWQSPSSMSIDLSGCAIEKASALRRALSDLPEVQTLNLSGSNADDTLIGIVSESCRQLCNLNVSGTRVTDRGITRLGKLPRLLRLDVSKTAIAGTGFGRLTRLRDLVAMGTTLSLEGARAIGQMPTLDSANLYGATLTEECIAAIARSQSIEDLDLGLCSISSQSVAAIAGMRALTRLSLSQGDSGIHRIETWCARDASDAVLEMMHEIAGNSRIERERVSIAPLARLERLESLDVTCLDVCWEQLANATFGRLKYLNLAGTDIQDSTADCLRVFPAIDRLNASDTGVSAAGLKYLPNPTLRELSFERNDLDDAGARMLLRFSQLEKLYVDDTAITNDGARQLLGLRNLKVLTMAGTVVDDRIVELIRARKSLEVCDLRDTRLTPNAISAVASIVYLIQ